MKYQLSKEEEGLIQLLRVVVGKSKRSVLPKDIDWRRLFDLSESHGVNAVALDGLEKYGVDKVGLKGVSHELTTHMFQWIGVALRIEQDYERKLVVVEQLIKLWKSYGIRQLL